MARVDAEIYDEFIFQIDSGPEHLIDSGYEEALYSFPLSRGYHVLTWKYVKDFSINEGSDSAAIYVHPRTPLLFFFFF